LATSLEIPKREQDKGISNREPPAIPEAPHAERAAWILRTIAVGILTEIPRVCMQASVMTVIVTFLNEKEAYRDNNITTGLFQSIYIS
jgi:hypothetical protein